MSLVCSRSLFFMVFVAGALALGLSYYLEYAVGLQPCGMCLLQRFFLAMFTGVCLLAAVHGPGRGGAFIYWLLALLCSLAGTVIAGRQVLLQGDPLQHLSACVNLADLWASAPWFSVVRQLFNGTADCARISWTLFDLSVPEWSLLYFVAMTALGVRQWLRLVWNAVRRSFSGESSYPAMTGD